MTKFSKSVAFVLGLTMALTLVAGVSANAQSMSLSDLIDALVKAGVISADKAVAAKAVATASTPSVSFTKDLTVGSTGAEVSALQTKLGVSSTGYFGTMTKAAVVAFQKENNLPSTGYVGALTRAKLNASAPVASNNGSTVVNGGNTGSNTVVNSGVEGTLTVDKFSVSRTTAYEGDTMVPVVAFKVQAKLSDINVQRVKLNLGASTSIYTKVYKSMYLVDDSGKVLAQAELNSNTVVKDGASYYLTLGGFSYNVAKDAQKVLTVKADVYSSIKTADQGSKTITLGDRAVRGTDGAGIDQYGPETSFSQSVTVSTTLSDSATLDLSTNSSNYKTTEVVAASGSNDDEMDNLAVLAFDVRANKADLSVTDLVVNIARSGAGTATATTAYLYEGSKLLATETVQNTGSATFTDANELFKVAKDETKVITVKVDVRNATAASTTLTASVASAGITVENTLGETKTVSGSATGEAMIVRNVGPVFTLGAKSIDRTGTDSVDATSTITATFPITIKAVGGEIVFASNASTTAPAFAFSVYNSSGVSIGSAARVQASGYSAPSSGATVVNPGTSDEKFTLAKNNSVTVTPSVSIAGKSATDGSTLVNVSAAIDSITWFTGTTKNVSNFMSGKTEWRTSGK